MLRRDQRFAPFLTPYPWPFTRTYPSSDFSNAALHRRNYRFTAIRRSTVPAIIAMSV